MSVAETQFLISQIPAVPELAEVAKTQWSTSHHAQNVRDVASAAKDTFMSSSLLTKALTIPFGGALIGFEGYELSWKNENKIASIATERFIESGGHALVYPARGVFEFTSKLELGITALAAIGLHKYRPALDIVRQRYFSEQSEPVKSNDEMAEQVEEEQLSYATDVSSIECTEDKSAEKSKKPRVLRPILKAGKILGLALSTGALGVTTIEDASREKGYSLVKNVATGAFASAGIATFNASITFGALWGIRTDTAYVSDGLMNIAEGIKSPAVMSSVIGGMMLSKTLGERKRIKQKWAAEAKDSSNETVVEASGVAIID